jgi:high-affinity K+ transport system ATPase subunit B
LDPNGDGSGYQIKFDTTSGSLSSGTAGVWLSLGSNQTIAVTRSTVGAKTWSGTVTIRRAADMVELDSASISLQVLVESGA